VRAAEKRGYRCVESIDLLVANLATRRVVGDPAAGRFATPPVSARLATHGRRLNPRVEILATSTHESTRAPMRNQAARTTMLL
jgi:hypothetical protein